MASVPTLREVEAYPVLKPGRGRTGSGDAAQQHAAEEQLGTLRREHDELRRTLFEAAHVQRRLCGPRQWRRGSFEIAAEIFPVGDLSGDFVSVFELGKENTSPQQSLDGAPSDVVFAVGDIAGKGLAAAMWFTHLLGMLRLHMRTQEDPAAALWAVNRDLCATQLAAPLTTLFAAKLDLCSGRLSYCNAGHPPAGLLRAGGEVEMLRQGGPLLGAVAVATFVNGETVMHAGDTLLGYSDGILEARNTLGEEFGVEGLLEALRQAQGSASAALFSVLAATEDFSGDQPREDDLALVVVRRT